MAAATSELVWVRTFLASLGIFFLNLWDYIVTARQPYTSQKNPVFHNRTEDVELDCHFVREKLVAGLISFAHIRSQQQPADILTKALSKGQFQYLKGKLGLANSHTPTWGGVLQKGII